LAGIAVAAFRLCAAVRKSNF